MSEQVTYPKSLRLFGLFLMLIGLFMLATKYIIIDAGGIRLADLSDKETYDIVITTLFMALPAAAGAGIIAKRTWGRALVVTWVFFGFLGLSIEIAAVGLYNNIPAFAGVFGLLVFITWFINRKSVRNVLAPTRRERIAYFALAVLILAVGCGWYYLWVGFGGPNIPKVVEMDLPAVPAPESYTYMFPGKFSIEVPDEYLLWYLGVDGMLLNKKGGRTRVALTDKTALQESGGLVLFAPHFEKPQDFADRYFHERYGLGFAALRRVASGVIFATGYELHHVKRGDLDIYIESGNGSLGYSETAHVYGGGRILGGVIYEKHDKEGVTPPEDLVLPGMLASIKLLDDNMSAADFTGIAGRYYAEGDMKAAILNYTYSLMLKPGDAEVRYRLASAYEADGQLKNSRYNLQEAMKLSPGDERIKSKFHEICERIRLEQARRRGEL